jgi:hypothetical protein
MTRFDPHTYPDRFAFQAQASQIRAAEIDKAFHALAVWAGERERALAERLRHLGAALLQHGHSHR